MIRKPSSESSGEDEGFMPNRVVVENYSKPSKERQAVTGVMSLENRKERPTDYQPRYICGAGLLKYQLERLRKQPPEVYEAIEEARVIEEPAKPERKQKRPRQRVDLTSYQLYFRSRSYRTVYSRFRERREPQDDDNFTSVYINLDNAVDYDSNAYSQLKAFDAPHMSDSASHTDLIFDSRFEGGNLSYAFRRMDSVQQEYDLFIQSDTNTVGYCQWFYFSLRNMKAGLEYRFSIVNFRKRHSLFQEGMKPAVFSMMRHHTTKNGWIRDARNVVYGRSKFQGADGQRSRLYTLSFTLMFEEDRDYVLVAMNLPYSYSRLMDFIRKEQALQETRQSEVNMRLETIGYSLSNNAVPLILVEPKVVSEGPKRMIVVSARQHPGETWSSFLMEGVIKQLLNSCSESGEYLRKYFTFAIFPMINVDGVIYGNFRCDISGVDLNRQWNDPCPTLHPQVHAIRQRIEALAQTYTIEIFLDLHGHSKKLNTFCYSCKDDDPYSCRVLPLLLSKFEPAFQLSDCTFGIDRWKENTARAFMFSVAHKVNMLTIESSFYGTKRPDEKTSCYQPSTMNSYASNILKAVAVYLGMSIGTELSRQTMEAEAKVRSKQFYVYDQNNQYDSGSESDPYADELDYEQKVGKVFTKRGLSVMNDTSHLVSRPLQQRLPRPKAVSPANKSPARTNNLSTIAKIVKERSMSIRNTSIVPKIGKSNDISDEFQQTETIDVTKLVAGSKPKQKSKTAIQAKLERSSQLGHNTSFKRRSIEPETTRYIVQPSVEMPLRSHYQKIRLAELSRNMYPVDLQRNNSSSSDQIITRKRNRRQSTKMPRVAILNDSIEQTMQRNHPVLVIMSDKKKQIISGGLQDKQSDWPGYNLFPIRRKDKTNGAITYQKFKQRSERQRSNLVHITKFWRENVDRYSRELHPPH